MAKLWAKEEEVLLEELYKTKTRKEIADILGRTESAIKAKLHILGLTKSTLTKGKSWTKEEEQKLIELYKTHSSLEISKLLERTKDSINNKLSSLKITKLTKDIISGPKSQTLKKVNKRVQEKFPSLEFIEYKGAKEPSLLKDNICGHTWTTRPEYVYNRGLTTKCPICNSTSTKYTKEILTAKINSKYPEIASFSLVGTKEYTDLNYICGHTDSVLLGDLINKGTKSVCRVCTPQRFTNKSHEYFLEEMYAINSELELLETYKNDYTYLKVRSKACNHEWKILPHNFLSKYTLAECPTCLPKSSGNNGTSKGENDLALFIQKYTNISKNPRILDGLEIDIFLIDKNIGIEYNGEYWHSDKHKGKNYHLDKTNLAESKGIRLIHIFEHEWLQKQDIVKSRILGMLQQNYKLGARLCTIRELTFSDIRSFLNENHIQGAGSPSSINLGLYYKDILVAVMTFSKPRFNGNYDYELIRYTSLTGINVQGGASKLLKYFTKKYKGSIISYSDKRWSRGNLYKTLGFELINSSKPSYFYAKNNKILSRYQCQKHRLKELLPNFYKDELTEAEVMASAGYYRVYDCGTDVWVYGTKE